MLKIILKWKYLNESSIIILSKESCLPSKGP